MIEKSVTLHICEHVAPQQIRISQYDTVWQFVFTVLYKGRIWEIPDGATVALLGRKSDGTEVSIDGTIEDNKVKVDCNGDLSDVAGRTMCGLSFMADGKRLGTDNFTVLVEQAAVMRGEATSTAADA